MLKYTIALLILFSIINISAEIECGTLPANSEFDCFTREAGKICCLVQTSVPEKHCALFNKTQMSNGTVICQGDGSSVTDFLGSSCPEDIPSDVLVAADNCTRQTIDNIPCCLYNNSLTNNKFCFRLGKISQSSLITYDNNLINCNALIYSLSVYSLVVYMLLLI